MNRRPARRAARWFAQLVVPALALSALLAACGGGGSGSGIATLDGKNNATNASNRKSAKKLDPQDAFRKYAECMRKHGIDMPDPKFSKNGGVSIQAAPEGGDGGGGTPQGPSPQFQAADKSCKHFVDDAVNGSGKKPDPEQQERMKEAALAFAKCMREHGIDMPDPQFEGDGRVTQQLGGNPNEDKFQAAQKACQKKMPGFGKKGGPGGNAVFNVNGNGPKGGSTSGSGK
jgi:hypothetical protein